MSLFDRRYGGRNRGTLRPDRKEKRQREAIERQARYDNEVNSGLVAPGQSLHWKARKTNLTTNSGHRVVVIGW